MIGRYSEDEALAAVTLLTRTRLTAFVEAEIITPTHSEAGLIFRQVDLARLELLCELSENFELDEDALAIVMSLIDQLHGLRLELRALTEAIANESPEVRTRIGEAVLGYRKPPADNQ